MILGQTFLIKTRFSNKEQTKQVYNINLLTVAYLKNAHHHQSPLKIVEYPRKCNWILNSPRQLIPGYQTRDPPHRSFHLEQSLYLHSRVTQFLHRCTLECDLAPEHF